MISIKTFTFNPFQENTYLLFNENKQCWIIDPGMFSDSENAEILNFIQHHNLIPQSIINTHAHLDHIVGVHFLQKEFGIPFYIHELDEPTLQYGPIAASMYGLGTINMPISYEFYNDNKMQLGDSQIEIIHTPGHAPGHVILYCKSEKWLINGDMLFAGSIGRTDLPGSNLNDMLKSLKEKIIILPDDTIVYCGHGIATSIKNEKASNPYLKNL
jgi:glyoxylase-like metal-dependent hydrolase (beta-lactamase superfamily II)